MSRFGGSNARHSVAQKRCSITPLAALHRRNSSHGLSTSASVATGSSHKRQSGRKLSIASFPELSAVSDDDVDADADVVGLDAIPNGMDEKAWYVRVAAGKAYGILDKRDTLMITIERTSVYGAALVLPQLARTAGYPLSFTTLTIRAYILLFANVCLQGFLLYMISKEERIMDKFGGQMRLCDFGAHLKDCPDGPNCVGPGGTAFTPDRLYYWSLWSTRRFLKDSFLTFFPERVEEINDLIDPGEYGVESYYLRIVSVYLFVLGLWADFASSLELTALLYAVPTAPEPWMSYDTPDLQEKIAKPDGWSELERLNFFIAGMPIQWKFANFFIVWLPKVYLWILTVDIGVVFLMETSKIEDMIINSVALAFILSIDEVIFASLMPTMAKFVLEEMANYAVIDDEIGTYWNKNAVKKHLSDLNWGVFTPSLYVRIFPIRLFAIGGICLFFMTKYYVESCRRTPDGSLVAKDVHLPLSDNLSFLQFLAGPIPSLIPVPVESWPVWTMPNR